MILDPKLDKNASIEVRGSKPGILKWLGLVCILSCLILIYLSSFEYDFVTAYHKLPDTIREWGWMGAAAIIGLMIVHCFIPFPAEFVALAAGSIYGPVLGTTLTWTGAMIGASISFGLTRFLGQPFVEWVLPEKQKKQLDLWTEDQGAFTLLVSRFIPLIAFNLINYAAGAYQSELVDFHLDNRGGHFSADGIDGLHGKSDARTLLECIDDRFRPMHCIDGRLALADAA